MRLAMLLVLAAALAACRVPNAARAQALSRAAEARARGDVVGEALALRDACAAAPRDRTVCDNSRRAFEAAIAATRGAAEVACSLADASEPMLDGCLAALEPIRRLDPEDGGARELAEAAGRIQADRCGPAPDDPAAAIVRVQCGAARAAAIGAPGYDTWLAAAREHAAARVLAVPADAGSGAEAALLAAATCLAPTDERTSERDRTAAAFVDRARVPLAIDADGLCAQVEPRLAGRVVCRGDVPGGIAVRARIATEPVEHTVVEDLRSASYLADVLRDDNPAYELNAHAEMRARDDLHDADEGYRRDQERCDRAETEYTRTYCTECEELARRDRACGHAEVSKALLADRETEWRTARDLLDATPPILEREVWSEARYTVQTHTWRAVWVAEVDVGGGAMTLMGATSTHDAAHDGSDPASIGADPLTSPDEGWYEPQVRDQVAAEIASLVDAELDRRVAAQRGACRVEDAAWSAGWLDCWALGAAWSGASIRGAELVPQVSCLG